MKKHILISALIAAFSFATSAQVRIAHSPESRDGEAAHALTNATYFKQLDATFPAPTGGADSLMGYRFAHLSAKISVYSLYCDLDHKKGYSGLASKFQARMSKLASGAQTALGGSTPYYNVFEDARNGESLVFAQASDVNALCDDNLTDYTGLLQSTPSKLQVELSSWPYGSF